jgi:hypothetical protein
MEPRLVYSAIGRRVYVVTRYSARPNGIMVAHRKYDVTEDFRALRKRRVRLPNLKKVVA